jgi:hypothetical protein
MRSLIGSRIAAAAVVMVAAVGASVAAALASTGDGTAPETVADTSKSFRVLSEPPMADAPDAVREFAADPEIAARYAPNPALTHRISLDGGSEVAYLVEGNSSLCFYVNGVGDCNTLAAADAGKMFVWGVKVPPRGQAPTADDGPSVVIGIVPDQFTTVDANAASGRVTANVRDNMYKVEGTNIDGFSLEGSPSVTPVEVSLKP